MSSLRRLWAFSLVAAVSSASLGWAAPTVNLGSVRSLTDTTDIKTPLDVTDTNFLAVSVNDSNNETVRGLLFQSDGQGNEPGNAVGAGPTIQISSPNRAANWTSGGNQQITGPDAAAMNGVITDIRWAGSGSLTTTLSNLTPGEEYRVQMIAYEGIGGVNRERVWDIIFDVGGADILAVDDFDSGGVLDPMQRSGAIWEHMFTATDSTLVIGFPHASASGVEDDNPILSGIILSQIAQPIPEPSSVAVWSLVGLACTGFGYVRFRRKSK